MPSLDSRIKESFTTQPGCLQKVRLYLIRSLKCVVLININNIVALQKRQTEINYKAADMWSFAIILWELATRNVPFADLSPMEAGMKVIKTFLVTIIIEKLTC